MKKNDTTDALADSLVARCLAAETVRPSAAEEKSAEVIRMLDLGETVAKWPVPLPKWWLHWNNYRNCGIHAEILDLGTLVGQLCDYAIERRRDSMKPLPLKVEAMLACPDMSTAEQFYILDDWMETDPGWDDRDAFAWKHESDSLNYTPVDVPELRAATEMRRLLTVFTEPGVRYFAAHSVFSESRAVLARIAAEEKKGGAQS